MKLPLGFASLLGVQCENGDEPTAGLSRKHGMELPSCPCKAHTLMQKRRHSHMNKVVGRFRGGVGRVELHTSKLRFFMKEDWTGLERAMWRRCRTDPRSLAATGVSPSTANPPSS